MGGLVEDGGLVQDGWLSRGMGGYIGIAASCYVDVLCFKSDVSIKNLEG